MFDFSLKKKKKRFAEFITLFYLEKEKDLARLLAIVKLFELDEVQLKCILRLRQSSALMNIDKVDDAFKVDVKSTKKLLLSKELHCDVEILFFGKSLDTLIKFASENGEALYIIPAEDSNDSIQFALNDNDHNYITFSIDKYSIVEIKSKIKQIYKQKNN